MKKLKATAIKFSKKNLLFRKTIRFLLTVKNTIKYIRYYFNKVDNKTVILESYMGRSYSGSPKAIYESMLQEDKYKKYNFIWAFKDTKKYGSLLKNNRTKIVEYKSNQYYKSYSKAKYWFSNSRIPNEIIKKENQFYTQCWHGTPLKRLGYDMLEENENALNTKKEMEKKYDKDTKRYDYFLSPSKFCTEKFKTAFNLKKFQKEDIIIEEGYPRNDFLFSYNKEDVINFKKRFKIPKDKKIILYAPTWRDNQHDSSLGYVYKTEVDFDYLKEKLSDQYVILFRAHYFVSNSFDFEKYKGFIYDVSKVDDINHLYIISDVLITDYSSVFFDYANLKRPIIFYMYDLEYYEKKLRGFYIDLKELPGEVVKTEKKIVEIVLNLDNYNKKHKNKYKKFNKKFNYLDDKNTSKRVVEKVVVK